MSKFSIRVFMTTMAFVPLAGCFGPNYEQVANKLRDENVVLKQDLSKSTLKARNDELTISRLQMDTPRTPTLPAERLAVLYTTDHVKLVGAMINANEPGTTKPGARPRDSFRVMFRPLSVEEFVLPATGDVTLEAFDLSIKTGDNRLGSWTFTPAHLKACWYGNFGTNYFAVDCPWSHPPAGAAITFKLTFTDALTGRSFSDQRVMTVAQQPSTNP